jgi:hypothetical protein
MPTSVVIDGFRPGDAIPPGIDPGREETRRGGKALLWVFVPYITFFARLQQVENEARAGGAPSGCVDGKRRRLR